MCGFCSRHNAPGAAHRIVRISGKRNNTDSGSGVNLSRYVRRRMLLGKFGRCRSKMEISAGFLCYIGFLLSASPDIL